LIGIHTRQTGGDGEFLYTPTSELALGWDRLIEGKIWGHWLAGVGPKFGVIVTTLPEGCQITHVFPDTPAAGADLQAGDWIQRIDGEPVASLTDIGKLLATRDPDELITLDVRRERRTFQAKLQLMQHRLQVAKAPPAG
jgi:S1-C subfamily serine protease